MRDFIYNTPTKVVFGKDSLTHLAELIKEQKCSKVLIHFGGSSAQRSGLLDTVYGMLDKAGIKHVSLGGVVPNPRLSKIYEGIELCRKEKVELILAVGGGSVIDSAKAIGYGVVYNGDVWDFYAKTAVPTAAIPVATVLTIPAAGSEMSNSSVITKEEGWLKRGITSELCRCKFAILNPEFTYTLPANQTINGIVDIMMHTMERYFVIEERLDITDKLGEGLIKSVMKNGKILLKNPKNYMARADIMWASSLSHNGLTEMSAIRGDWSTHGLEHELSGMFDVAHGAGLSAVWASWARHVYKTRPERFAKFATDIMSIPANHGNTNELALAGIKAVETYFKEINSPTSIKELGIDITDAQIEEMANKVTNNDKVVVGTFMELHKSDVIKIYTAAK